MLKSTQNIISLARREMNSIFLSPLAYAVLAVFLFLSGFFFYSFTDDSRMASLAPTISAVSFIFFFAIPMLNMRLLSEEYRSGTIESLMTAPVTDAQVVLGKYLGSIIFLLFMITPTLLYLVILALLGDPEYGVVISSYLGMLLSGAMFTALALFCSSLTKHQILAGILGFVMLLTLWILGEYGSRMSGLVGMILEYAGAQGHAGPMYEGRISLRDVFYFVSLTFFWLFLTVRVLESKRWR